MDFLPKMQEEDRMTHAHEHEAGMFQHHQTEYNVEKIVRNLLLIQDHYVSDPCADCLNKHWNLVLGYEEEGRTLDGNAKFQKDLHEVEDLANRHLKTVVECAVGNTCKVKKPEDMARMIAEVRTLRRRLNQRIYGLEGDITHDVFEQERKEDKKEEHAGHSGVHA